MRVIFPSNLILVYYIFIYVSIHLLEYTESHNYIWWLCSVDVLQLTLQANIIVGFRTPAFRRSVLWNYIWMYKLLKASCTEWPLRQNSDQIHKPLLVAEWKTVENPGFKPPLGFYFPGFVSFHFALRRWTMKPQPWHPWRRQWKGC